MTGVDARVSNLLLDSILQLKVSEKMHPEWGSFSIPTFDQVLQLCKGKINIYLDFKNAPVQATMQAIKAHHMEKQIIVYINTPNQFKEWRSMAPEMPLMVSLPPLVKSEEALSKFITQYQPDLLDGSYDDYNEQLLQVAAKNNRVVWPDIQSSQEQNNWDKAIQMGLKGLQTDHPRALIQYLKKISSGKGGCISNLDILSFKPLSQLVFPNFKNPNF